MNRNADTEVIMICMYIYIKVNMYTYIELKLMQYFRRPISGPGIFRWVKFPDFERVST